MFVIILVSVLRHGTKKDGKESKMKRLMKKAIITLVLAVMFGLGWIFGILSSIPLDVISIPFSVLFVIIVAFQGLLIFLLHPCRSKDAREEWKKWFHILTCRSQTYQNQLKQSKQSKNQSSDHSSSSSTSNTFNPNRRGSNQPTLSSTADSIAARYGYNRRRSSDQSVSTEGTSTLRMATLKEVVEEEEEDHFMTDESASITKSDLGASPINSTPSIKKKPLQKEVFMFENTNALVTFEDENQSSEFVNVIESVFNDSDLMEFSSSDSDSMTFQNRNFDDGRHEAEGEAETVFYNFEDDC